MDSDWDRVKELFAACADLDGERLELCLAAAPQEIRREVEALLAAERDSGSFLGGRACPTRLGAYELMAKIGEGGMGSVWEARRVDGQFEQRVAIKIIREHCDSPGNLELFRAERQLLARLDHPNISRLLDGGTTAEGLPYLVMELIEGLRIDVYCREHALTVDQTLCLFLPICDAVEYASRCGVLHRDLKPANILVTPEGVPKLVDFGIAKALGANIPLTTTLHRMATPEYASPEHLLGKSLTAASDVYSLGVTAFELLTGTKPHSGTGSCLPELIRTICESAPPKPSSLCNQLSTDIDKIIAKAMHKDPARRYTSAWALKKDIEAHLLGQPVLARGDSISYRLGRFLSVNRRVAAAAVAAFVLGGIAWGSWSYLHVRRFTHRSLAVIGIRGELSDPSIQWLERGVAETLTVSLLQSGAFQVVSSDRVRSTARGRTTAETARLLDTELYVEGVLTGGPAKIRLDLRVHETATGQIVFASGFESPSGQAVFLLADQAASQIAGRLTTALPTIVQSKSLLTPSSEALRSYEDARQELGKWHINAARKGFRKAIDLDPQFAMAYIGIAESVGMFDRLAARSAILQAGDLAATRSLPRFQMNLIHGLRLYYDGRIEDAVEVLRALSSEFPHEASPVFWEGIAHMYGLRRAEATVAFEQVTRMDPENALGWLMLAQANGLHNLHDAARSAASRYCRLIGDTEQNCYGAWGDIYVAAERWDDAIEQYRKGKLPLMTASALWVRGDSGESSRLLANDNAKSPQAAFVDGNAAAAGGDIIRALDLYEQSAKLYPNRAYSYLQLLKAAEIWLEMGKPANVLTMTNRHSGPWVPGISAIAYLVLGNRNAAEAEFTLMRASLTPLIGQYSAARTEELHRLLAAFYRGEHESVVAFAAGLPRHFWTLSSFPVGRSLIELGRFNEAREQLDTAWQSRLYFPGPGLFEEQSGLRTALTEFYQGKLAERQGRVDDTRRWLRGFLRRFRGDGKALPQVAEARRILSRL